MNHATLPAIILVHVPPTSQRQLQAEAEVRAAAEQRAADAEQRAADAASNRQSASHRASQGPGGFFHAVNACAAIWQQSVFVTHREHVSCTARVSAAAI